LVNRSQPEIKAIHGGTLRMMCTVLTSGIFVALRPMGDLETAEGSDLVPS